MSRRVPTLLCVELLEGREVPATLDTAPVLPADDPAVVDNVRAIAALGHALGRRADVFLKVGDSNTATAGYGYPHYLTPLGEPGYDPAASGLTAIDPDLVTTLTTFRAPVDGTGANSFNRTSTSAYPGWTLADALPRVPGELATTNAGTALIMIGGNDAWYWQGNAELYRALLRQLVTTLTAAGVVPVLSTNADRFDLGPVVTATVRLIDQVVIDVGEEFRVPVWNLNRALAALPGRGLSESLVHLTYAPAGGGDFNPPALQYGQNLRNLEALQVLDWLRTRVFGPAEAVAPSKAWTPLTDAAAVVAVGRDLGQGPVVSVYDAGTGGLLNRFLAFDASFTGGVRVAVADVNGDGYADVVATPGPGGGPVLAAFSGRDGSVLASRYAFDPSFRDGFTVAAGDLDGDGRAEVVVGAGAGGGPHVAVFRGGDLAVLGSFFAFDPAFRGGVSVAVGDFAGVGPAVAVGAGPGGGPVVRLFPSGPAVGATFLVGDAGSRGGVAVAAGDLDGDGAAELAAGTATGEAQVTIIDPSTGRTRLGVTTGDGTAGVRPAIRGGVLFVGNGPGSATAVRAYRGLTAVSDALLDDPGRVYGVFVG